MTQKDAVYSAVSTVLNNAGISFTASSTSVFSLLTRELRSQINAILVTQFENNEIELSVEAKGKLANKSELKAYVSGLVSNWVRKDARLNGGSNINVSSVSKRIFKSDPQIKAMQLLLSTKSDPNERIEIQSFIDNRISQLS
jgi:hypothetical protein